MTKNKSSNKNLRKASSAKNDEFYTQLTDIEKELGHYKDYFKGKVVFCNCDDPEESNFWNYFALNFEFLGLKKLVSTHYEEKKPSYKLEIVSDINNDGKINKLDTVKTPLKQNGDFRSPECIEILKESDIVVTNPPFSLFREYISQLIEYKKNFIVIGNQNAITYREIFELIKDNKIWLGVDNGGTKWFQVPEHYDIKTESRKKIKDGKKYFSLGSIMWYTNIETKKRNEELILYKTYNKEEYPNYDNYNAINVNKVAEIPLDFKGFMGVPITFIDKYNPKQFKLYGIMNTGEINKGIRYEDTPHGRPLVNGVEKYLRILIKNKKI